MKRIASFMLCLWMLLCATLVGCGEKPKALMGNVTPQAPFIDTTIVGSRKETVSDFAVRLFCEGFDKEENTLISPISVLYALGMTANGARGETLTQMEAVFGMSSEELNAYLLSYGKALPQGEKYKLSLANSIWLTDHSRFSVERDFLQANGDYYGADIYQVPFDKTTLYNINAWVEDATNGMVRDILDDIPYNAVMYLVNAIAFEAEWKEIYYKEQIREDVFTAYDGETCKVDMMHSEESCYLDDGMATGFIKHYADEKYAFVALLPNEGISIEEYVGSLTGEGLQALLSAPKRTTVYAAMPRFESEYDVDMKELLSAMGMRDAFSMEDADFSGLGYSDAGNICIDRVLHKAFISVDAKGTRAGAATVVEMVDKSMELLDFKTVTLDRPFVYMIIDYEAKLPLFIGALMKPE